MSSKREGRVLDLPRCSSQCHVPPMQAQNRLQNMLGTTESRDMLSLS